MNTSPAPWFVGNDSGWTALIVDADGKMVARTQHRVNGPDNALLLAAAPGLRDMLRRVEELLRKSGMACNCDGCRYCATAAEIRAILAPLEVDPGTKAFVQAHEDMHQAIRTFVEANPVITLTLPVPSKHTLLGLPDAEEDKSC